MTELLERAWTKVSSLPDNEQNAIASVILTELESEELWQRMFDASPDLLSAMGKEALAEYRAGKTLPLDPEKL